jgi:hypothetical protein
MAITPEIAIKQFKSFVKTPRVKLPWLRGRQYLYACPAAYSWIVGLHPAVNTCHELKAICVKNKTWTTDLAQVKPGHAVIFDWENGAGLGHNTNTDHVGMVISVNKDKTVTYVSADSTRPTPGLVTVNTIATKWITGFGVPQKFGVVGEPIVHPASSTFHNAPVTSPAFGVGGQPLN